MKQTASPKKAKPPNRQRTLEELQGALRHVVYEVEMLHRAYRDYWKKDGPTDQREWHYAYVLESTLVHTRVLIDFFQSAATWDGDVSCEVYGFARKQFLFPSRTATTGEEMKTHIDKSIAHLTFDRLKTWDTWQWGTFIPVILRRGADFFCQIKEKQPEWVPDRFFRRRIDAFIEDSRDYTDQGEDTYPAGDYTSTASL